MFTRAVLAAMLLVVAAPAAAAEIMPPPWEAKGKAVGEQPPPGDPFRSLPEPPKDLVAVGQPVPVQAAAKASPEDAPVACVNGKFLFKISGRRVLRAVEANPDWGLTCE